jgi:pSer/pThr/pTyr-binding forkhead associated (FHA) protein
MATPAEDELRTIGLPRGAAQEMLRRLETPQRPAPDGAPVASRGLDPDGRPPRSVPPARAAVPDRKESRHSSQGPPEQDILATAALPRQRRPALDPAEKERPLANSRPRSDAGPLPTKPRREQATEEKRAATPPRSSRLPIVPQTELERPLDEPDCSTADLPRSAVHAATRPFQETPGNHAIDVAVPLGEDSGIASVPFVAPSQGRSTLSDTAEDSLTQTPHALSGRESSRWEFPSQAPRGMVPAGRCSAAYDDLIEHTVGWVRSPSTATGAKSTLQFFHNGNRRWADLGEVRRDGVVLGRYTLQAWDANPDGLALEHLKIGFDGEELYVEPLESLNGVYRKLRPHRPEELAPHTRFRIGRHVLEFRLAAPAVEITPTCSSDGEVFQSRVLVPLGFIDVLGPDGRICLSFPVTKHEDGGTRIGRSGPKCDIALTGDEWVSHLHARFWFNGAKCWLEDLESTNGTFLIVNARIPLRRGTTQHPDTGDEILVGGYKLRVIEETA